MGAGVGGGMFNTRVLYQDAVLDNASYVGVAAPPDSAVGKKGAKVGKKSDNNFDTVSLRSQDADTVR